MPSFRVLINNAHGFNQCVGIVFSEEEENGLINSFFRDTGNFGAIIEPEYLHPESDTEGIEGTEDFDTELGL